MKDNAGNGLSCADRFRLAPAVGVWSFGLSLLRLGLTKCTSSSSKPSPSPCFLLRGVSLPLTGIGLLGPVDRLALSASWARSCCKNRLSVSIFSLCFRIASSSAFCFAASSACNFCMTLSRRSYSFAAFSSFARTIEISPCLVAAAARASCSKRRNRLCSASSSAMRARSVAVSESVRALFCRCGACPQCCDACAPPPISASAAAKAAAVSGSIAREAVREAGRDCTLVGGPEAGWMTMVGSSKSITFSSSNP